MCSSDLMLAFLPGRGSSGHNSTAAAGKGGYSSLRGDQAWEGVGAARRAVLHVAHRALDRSNHSFWDLPPRLLDHGIGAHGGTAVQESWRGPGRAACLAAPPALHGRPWAGGGKWRRPGRRSPRTSSRVAAVRPRLVAGDRARMRRFADKLLSGKGVKIGGRTALAGGRPRAPGCTPNVFASGTPAAGLVGGSIAWGHGVAREKGSADLGPQFFNWIRRTFPGNHTLVNGAIPAMPSYYMALCLRWHIPEDADLVILEVRPAGRGRLGRRWHPPRAPRAGCQRRWGILPPAGASPQQLRRHPSSRSTVQAAGAPPSSASGSPCTGCKSPRRTAALLPQLRAPGLHPWTC